MKKLFVLSLAILSALVMITVASAGTVMYSGGGAASDFVNGAVGALNIEKHFDEPFDLSDADCLYIRYYVEDIEAYANNGQIEITSSGSCDNQEYNWNLNNMDIDYGWNEWCIDLYTGSETGGTPAFDAINYFRIYFFTEGENLVALDYVAFGAEGEDFSYLNTELGEVKREEHVAENRITRESAGNSGALNVQAVMELNPVNAEDYDLAFIRLYLDGVDNLTGEGQLELTSKLTCDSGEINWMSENLDLQDGWNEIEVELWFPDSFSDDFDMANVNFFRLYLFTDGPLTMKLDYVGFGMEGDKFGPNLPAYLVPPAEGFDESTVETTATETEPEITLSVDPVPETPVVNETTEVVVEETTEVVEDKVEEMTEAETDTSEAITEEKADETETTTDVGGADDTAVETTTESDSDSNTGVIVGIVVAAVCVVGVIVAAVVVRKKK